LRIALFGITVTVLLTSIVLYTINVEPVSSSGTIYIRADGSIDPPTANITTSDNISYYFTDNNYDSVVVERSNIIIDGSGYTLQGSGSGSGFQLNSISNVTIKNTNIHAFADGFYIQWCSFITIFGNRIENSTRDGVLFEFWCCNNTIIGNTIVNSTLHGIYIMSDSCNNSISENTISRSTGFFGRGISLDFNSHNNRIFANKIINNTLGMHVGAYQLNNIIFENNIANNNDGLVLSNNVTSNIHGNNITNSEYGIYCYSESSRIFHNNFVNITQYIVEPGYANFWDDGYPSGGNYWSDYTGVDYFSGLHQNETGSDGVGDTPYILAEDNRDNYPLMHPWVQSPVYNANTSLGYNTIQEAINAPQTLTGHLIYVKDGDYQERIAVNKSLSLIGAGKFNTVIDGNYSGDVIRITADNVRISGFTIKNGGNFSLGVHIDSSHNAIYGNIIEGSMDGIFFKNSDSNNISGNHITANLYRGILTINSDNNTFSHNAITNSSFFGIGLWSGSDNNKVYANKFTYNVLGVEVWNYSMSNTIFENEISSNEKGIFVWNYSSHNHILDNNITLNTDMGIRLWNYANNNVIFGNKILNNDNGIIAAELSFGNIICNNTINSNTYEGIWVYNSSGNEIYLNNIKANGWDGILLQFANDNVIHDNAIESNLFDGIWLYDFSNFNEICRNSINGNHFFGVEINNCSGNIFYFNNFNGNGQHAHLVFSGHNNNWDNDYPSGGNYWSDYNGTDLFRGAYQNETGSDGIGDTPYIIDMNNIDHYPLMGPVGSSTQTGENITVFPTDYLSVIYANITQEGETMANMTDTGPTPPEGRQWLARFIVETTAGYSGKVMIRIIYTDANLTSEEEGSLQLAHWMLQGDITGTTGVPDGVVDIRDIALIAVHFGEDVRPAPPRCDITGPTPNVPDGKIDIRDIALAAINFGNNQPEWINITTYLDTENNIIFGETSRLSIFGVHFR